MDNSRNKINKIIEELKKNKKIAGITLGVTIALIIGIIVAIIVKKDNNRIDDSLKGVFPESKEFVEISMGTYYEEKQKDYCKIKLPGNYYGWSMYLDKENVNKNFEMANSHELSYSVENGLLDKEEAIQQFHYSNFQLVEKETTDIYANIYTKEQITYDGMKSQMSGAVEIKEIGKNAFYSKGDKKYTDIDVTMYYKLTNDITLEVSYKGPMAEKLGVDKIAHRIYESIEVIK